MEKQVVKEFFDNFAPRWDYEPTADKKILDIIHCHNLFETKFFHTILLYTYFQKIATVFY